MILVMIGNLLVIPAELAGLEEAVPGMKQEFALVCPPFVALGTCDWHVGFSLQYDDCLYLNDQEMICTCAHGGAGQVVYEYLERASSPYELKSPCTDGVSTFEYSLIYGILAILSGIGAYYSNKWARRRMLPQNRNLKEISPNSNSLISNSN